MASLCCVRLALAKILLAILWQSRVSCHSEDIYVRGNLIPRGLFQSLLLLLAPLPSKGCMSFRCVCFALAKAINSRGNLNPYKKPSLCKGRGTTVGGGRVVLLVPMPSKRIMSFRALLVRRGNLNLIKSLLCVKGGVNAVDGGIACVIAVERSGTPQSHSKKIPIPTRMGFLLYAIAILTRS